MKRPVLLPIFLLLGLLAGPSGGALEVGFKIGDDVPLRLAQSTRGERGRLDLERPDAPQPPERPGAFRPRRHQSEMVRVLDDLVVREDESVSEFVSVLGDARVDGEVRGDGVAVMGSVTVNGRVNGDLVVVMGGLQLGSGAVVDGDVWVVGGRFEEEAGSRINGQRHHHSFGNLGQDVASWCRSGLILARPLPPRVPLAWSLLALHFLIYLIITVVIPRPVTVCANELRVRLGPCFLVGLLGLVLSAPIAFILATTGVGVFLLPLLVLVMTGAIFLGKAAALQCVGVAAVQRFNEAARPAPLAALVIGGVVVALIYMVPLLGGVAWAVLVPLGFGSVLLALAEAFRQGGEADRPAGAGLPLEPPGIPPTGPETGFASESTVRPDAGVAAPPTPDSTPPPPKVAAPAWTPGASGPCLASASSFPPGELEVMPRVGFWLRLVATFLDFVLLIWILPVAHRWFVPIWIAYHAAMWTWKGTTIGGIVCGLKVIRLDGRPLDFGVALVRSLGAVFSLAAAGIGFFWAGWSPESQAWHDRIAGTVIVKLPKGVSLV
ncbi:MAG: RDD family protein [Verrucomicrobiales bacterium]|nr:RDD family protein [Verrucomicrobiales bacterium]